METTTVSGLLASLQVDCLKLAQIRLKEKTNKLCKTGQQFHHFTPALLHPATRRSLREEFSLFKLPFETFKLRFANGGYQSHLSFIKSDPPSHCCQMVEVWGGGMKWTRKIKISLFQSALLLREALIKILSACHFLWNVSRDYFKKLFFQKSKILF